MLDIILILVATALCVKPLGNYMARVYNGERVFVSYVMQPLETMFYRLAGTGADSEMNWRKYAVAVLTFSQCSTVFLFIILLTQTWHPFNPEHFPSLSADLAFNTAVSFVTNTNWQAYAGENTLSYFSQMLGLTVQNFISPAVGMAVAVAVFRGFARKNTATIGNFWADVVRGILYILLPLSIVWATLLASQGVVQSVSAYVDYQPLGATSAEAPPPIPLGPAASQVAIKQIGTNGGGFFGTNSTHPLENPTPFSNFLEALAILLIPAAFVYTFGVMVNDRRQSWSILSAMAFIFFIFLFFSIHFESTANPRLGALGLNLELGNMEGKELRFGVDPSVFWANATTATSSGSVNSMHASFMPLASLGPLLLMQLGEVIFGGAGSGMYGMTMFVIIAVFIGGLMVGRTPEYLCKKLGPYEIKMASLVILTPAALVLLGTAIAVSVDAGRAGVLNSGPHGFTEILYAVSSAANNNGSAFAGLSVNTPFYNTLLGICMFFGRFFVIIPVLAIAGALASRNSVPISNGTLPTHTPFFTGMLVGIVVLLGVLTYIPSLALGPVAEHLKLFAAGGVTP